MAKLDVPPTRSQWIELRKNLDFAQQGYELLDQKRTVLTMELMSRLEAVRQTERDLDPLLARAFAALRDTTLDLGSAAVERKALSTVGRPEIKVSSRPVMGLSVPVLEIVGRKPGPQFGALDTPARLDEAVKLFEEALVLVARLAELQNLVIRLARELRKTQRRVNALEKIFIPAYRETITYIADSLEERERESTVVMKMIKARQTASRAAAEVASER
jgi:V/A-type H+/Na+-transporting ATPase subunit D